MSNRIFIYEPTHCRVCNYTTNAPYCYKLFLIFNFDNITIKCCVTCPFSISLLSQLQLGVGSLIDHLSLLRIVVRLRFVFLQKYVDRDCNKQFCAIESTGKEAEISNQLWGGENFPYPYDFPSSHNMSQFPVHLSHPAPLFTLCSVDYSSFVQNDLLQSFPSMFFQKKKN